MPSQRYWELLYRGASLPQADMGTIGANLGMARGPMLATLVAQGKLKPQQLSPQDTRAAASNMDKAGRALTAGPLGLIPGAIGGFFGNLGADVWDAAKGLAPGIARTGSAIVHDVMNPSDWGSGTLVPVQRGKEGRVAKDVVAPTVASYKYTYGGVGAPRDSSLWSRIYEHPLGPIMDVATVASLGTGGLARAGSLLSNAGKISSENPLARLGSTQGRAALRTDLDAGEGVVAHEIPRNYSPRPLRKGLQILTDKAGQIPLGKYENPIYKAQLWQSRNYGLKMGSSRKDSRALQLVQQQVHQMIPLLKDLSPTEFQAFDLVARGINSPEWIAKYENAVGRSVANDLPEGANATDFGKIVDERLAPSRADLPEETKELAINPAKSDKLMAALQHYYNVVEDRIAEEMPEDQLTTKTNELRGALTELDEGDQAKAPVQTNNEPVDYDQIARAGEDEGVYVEDLLPAVQTPVLQAPQTPQLDHPFPDPTIAPVQVARNFKWHEPTRLGELFGREAGFRRHQGQFSPSNVTYQNVLQEPFNTYRPNPNPLLAGVHRPDPRQYVDLIAKHERDVVDQAYSAELLNKWALKDENGEPLTVTSADEAKRKYGEQYTAVHPTAPLHYYSDQTTVADMVSYMEEHGFPVDGPEMNAAIESLGEDTVIKMTSAARKEKAYVIPQSVAEYQRKIENASKPYENSALRAIVKPMNVWRQYTLSLMPRWALNTAVGSFMLDTIKGVGPKDYWIANKLRKGTDEDPNMFREPSMGGVELGNMVGMEMQELSTQAGMGTNRVAQFSMHKVQQIEDFFRRASMVQSLSKEAKQAIRENGTVIADFERARGPRTVDEYRDLILENPDMVKRALEDVDRFSYNFAALGPFERRAIRQIAPFWGWYRFISGVAYRLPLEYPGRTNIMANLGLLGMSSNEGEFGEMPSWLKGNILADTAGPGISYLGTAGLNPFSQIFNPMQMANPVSEEGLAGVAQLGQASPIIQSVMAGFGINPMSGGSLDVSPESGVSPDLRGTLRDETTGEEKNLAAVEPMQRMLATMVRAFPEARIGERFRGGGKAVYPESIPVLHERYRATDPDNRYGGTLQEALAQMFGVAVRPFSLEKYQRARSQGKRSAMRKGARQRSKIKRAKKK